MIRTLTIQTTTVLQSGSLHQQAIPVLQSGSLSAKSLVTGHKLQPFGGNTMAKDKQVVTAQAVIEISSSLRILESLRSKRMILDGIVKETREKIDEKSKKVKKALRTSLATLDIETACNTVTSLCKSRRGADDSERQRNQRARNWCIKELAGIFPEYDIENRRGTIRFEHVGDANVREARSILEDLKEYARMGITLEMTEKDIIKALKDDQVGANVEAGPIDDGFPSSQELLASVGVTVAQDGETAEKVEEKVEEPTEEKTDKAASK